MIDKREFDAIIREHGHNVYLQRRSLTAESGPYRDVAGGRYENRAEKWTVWRYYPGAPTPKMDTMGIVDGSSVIFYFQAEANPKKADLISEATPHERTPQNTFRVEFSIPYYDGDDLIFFAAHCKLLDPVS